MRAAVLMLVVAVAVVLALVYPPSDINILCRATTAELYTPATRGFFYAPWALPLLAPCALSLRAAWVWLNALGAIATITGLYALGVSPVHALLALAWFPVAHVWTLGQWDLLITAALLWAAWALQERRWQVAGLSLLVLTTKPVNVLPALLYILAVAPPTEVLLPTGVGLLLSLLAGAWPLRYLAMLGQYPPIQITGVTLRSGVRVAFQPLQWPPALLIGAGYLTGRRVLADPWRALALAGALGLLLSPHVHSNHMVTLIPALAWLLTHSRRAGLLLAAVFALAPLVWLLSGWSFPLAALPLVAAAAITLVEV